MVTRPAGIAGGSPEPLGATCDGNGVNFALFSANGEKVELCLFDRDGEREIARLALAERSGDIWHGYLPGAQAGQLYGYRVHGPYDPSNGHRFNPNKLLVDPYARALDRPFVWNDLQCGYAADDPRLDLSFDPRDSAATMPKCRVVDPAFDWGGDAPPAVPSACSVIYELHVRGYTMLHPALGPAPRGTFAALSNPDIVRHLRDLGVTAVELLPVHPIATSRRLSAAGLRDYWGYNSINFFALEPRYLSHGDCGEFRHMVRTFHDAGIEVILDVVFNHTGEGDELGPTLSFRGIDNASYYRLAEDRRRYFDSTGCRNTLNVDQPHVVQLVVDSLRYWAEAMHVDGFRFDLAVSLARRSHHFSPEAPLLAQIAHDPVLSGRKLIAEPWDVGVDGYQLGAFPPPWCEWNDRFRDTVRRYWRGDPGQIEPMAYRLSGSSDIFERAGRSPTAGINYVTAHDGFTLSDLVSYTAKRNAGNGEDNNDGTNENFSSNCGAEGPTADPEILALRRRRKRNLIATLVLSQGIPMLLAGDEMGRTQDGNNNAYAQDNPISWIDWRGLETEAAFFRFVRKLLRLRAGNAVFRRTEFFRGTAAAADGLKDVAWLRPDGGEMQDGDWPAAKRSCLGILFGGDAAADRPAAFLLLMNPDAQGVEFAMPAIELDWRCVLDTTSEDGESRTTDACLRAFEMAPHALALLAGRRR